MASPTGFFGRVRCMWPRNNPIALTTVPVRAASVRSNPWVAPGNSM